MDEVMFPDSTSNPNVPKRGFIVLEWNTMSREIGHTLYIDPDDDCLYQVDDWVTDKPYRVGLDNHLPYIDSHDLYVRYSAWKRSKGENHR